MCNRIYFRRKINNLIIGLIKPIVFIILKINMMFNLLLIFKLKIAMLSDKQNRNLNNKLIKVINIIIFIYNCCVYFEDNDKNR
jgi:hypothetical protein